MLWYRLDESTGIRKDYIRKFNEGCADLRDSLIDDGVFAESENKYMNWLKGKLSKLCPSPEKLKSFFKGIGQKMDSKIQACKYDYVKQAWGNLKDMATADECPEVDPEEVGIQPQGGADEVAVDDELSDENGEGEEGAEGEVQDDEEDLEMASEGFWDSIKSGWNKLTGGGREEPVTRKGGRSGARKGGRTATRKSAAKRPVAKRGGASKAKRPTSGKTGAKRGSSSRSVPSRGKGKKSSKANKKTKMQTVMQKILQFLKDHWKQITVVLIVCLAIYFLGAWVAALFAKSSVAKSACETVTKPQFRMPCGMTSLPKGAKLIGNGVVKFANGGILASGDTLISDDF